MKKAQFLDILDDTTPDVSYETDDGKYIFGFTRDYIEDLLDKSLANAKPKTINLEWHVFCFSPSNCNLQIYNIFSHRNFYHSVLNAFKNEHDKPNFAAKIRGELMYYFWSKAEYEILISDWTSISPKNAKVDVYEQVMMNFDRFIDYLWSFVDE